MTTEIRPPWVPARVVVVDARPGAGHDRHGRALFALDVTVLAEGRDPFRTRLSVGLPAAALDRVHPGAELAAVLVGEGDLAVPVLRLDEVAEVWPERPADQASERGDAQ